MKRHAVSIAAALEGWFARVKRPMPWRKKVTPYGSYLSEIMMQQTTYAGVLSYYERFLKRFPTIEVLAKAEESEVLKLWEGLGYYARARNLLKAARIIAPPGQKSAWPNDAAAWRAIPGVGPYTAAALSSVLNGERVPVVDGNVARVFARVWCLKDDFHGSAAREKLALRLQAEIDAAKVPGDFNQAMMELGALVCTPKSPDCEKCPLRGCCGAFKAGCIEDYPRRSERKTLPVRKADVVVIRDAEGKVLLVQNREGGLLKGLWELPTIARLGEHVQIFSHFRQELTVWTLESAPIAFCDPKTVPLTTATRKILKK